MLHLKPVSFQILYEVNGRILYMLLLLLVSFLKLSRINHPVTVCMVLFYLQSLLFRESKCYDKLTKCLGCWIYTVPYTELFFQKTVDLKCDFNLWVNNNNHKNKPDKVTIHLKIHFHNNTMVLVEDPPMYLRWINVCLECAVALYSILI